MAPIQPSQPAVVSRTAASQIYLTKTGSSSGSDSDNDSLLLDSSAYIPHNSFADKQWHRRKAVFTIAIVVVCLLVMASALLCTFFHGVYKDRMRVRERLRIRRARLNGRNGMGWFDRWSVTVTRRTAAQRAQRRRSLGRETILPVPTADDYRRFYDSQNGSENSENIESSDNSENTPIDIVRPRSRPRMQRPNPLVYPSGRSSLRSFVGTRNYKDPVAPGYQVRPLRRRE